MGPALGMAVSGEAGRRCQLSMANARLFRCHLAETSHPADINILIGVTIYSNNLTMLTHAEQMGWGRGPELELVRGGGPQLRMAGLLGGVEWKGRGSVPLPACRWALGVTPGPHPCRHLGVQTAGDVREMLGGRRPFMCSFFCLEDLLSA